MIRKFIGSAEVVNGKAEYHWIIDSNTTPGKRKIYVSYLENDGYLAGEAWENAYIRTPTSLVFTEQELYVKGTDDENNPQTIDITVNANDLYYLEPVTIGEVQFQYQTIDDNSPTDIGEPIPLNDDGTATINYTVPNLKGKDIYIFAVYIPAGDYANCTTEEPLILHVKKGLNLELSPTIIEDITNPTINIQATDDEGNPITEGRLEIYFDGELIHSEENIDFGNYSYTHTLPEELSTGEHTFLIKFNISEEYESPSKEVCLYVREDSKIVIDEYTWGNQATINENGEEELGESHINATILDMNDNPITMGTVTLDILDYQETVGVDENGRVSFIYYINSQYQANDEIPYLLTYNKSDKYNSSTDSSKIIIRTKVYVNLEPTELLIGQPNTLNATANDEFGNNVDKGQISFEIETSDDE